MVYDRYRFQLINIPKPEPQGRSRSVGSNQLYDNNSALLKLRKTTRHCTYSESQRTIICLSATSLMMYNFDTKQLQNFDLPEPLTKLIDLPDPTIAIKAVTKRKDLSRYQICNSTNYDFNLYWVPVKDETPGWLVETDDGQFVFTLGGKTSRIGAAGAVA